MADYQQRPGDRDIDPQADQPGGGFDPQEAEPADLDYLRDLWTELKASFSSDDDQIDLMRLAREKRAPIFLDKKYRLVNFEVHDPSIADEIFRATATLSVNLPSLSVTPHAKGDKAIQNGTLREKATEQLLFLAGARMPGKHTFTLITDAIVADGGGWSKLLWDRDSWDEVYKLKIDDYQDDKDEVDVIVAAVRAAA